MGLILRATRAISEAMREISNVDFKVDGPSVPSGRPPLIDGFRPDLYVSGGDIVVVGEAKPPWDVESPRSERQLKAFLRYVEQHQSRHMVLAVHWTTASTAQSVLRSVSNNWPDVRSRVHILDGLKTLSLPINQEMYAPGN